jgi:hypothetical protein
MGIKSSADIFFIVSVAAVLMAVISWAIEPMWLAASQWISVGIMVGIWGLYLRIRDMHEGNGKNGKKK